MTHELRIKTVRERDRFHPNIFPPIYKPICSCRWSGHETQDRDEAVKEGKDHVRENDPSAIRTEYDV